MTNGSPSLNDDISVDAILKTLLVTDLVDSTQLVEKLGDARAYKVAAQHDRVARDLLPRYGGHEVNKTDGFLLLFERPIDAVGYALDYHQALARLSNELGVALLTRAGIHLGEILMRKIPAEDVARGAQPLEVEGIAKPMAARVMSLARGRQTLLTRAAFELARRAAVGTKLSDPKISWHNYGFYQFKGVEEPMEICEVGREGFAPLSAPPSSEKAQCLGETPEAEAPSLPRLRSRQSLPLRRPRNRNPFYHRQGITDPGHFFGRADLVRSLLEMMASGQSCAVVGERRIGKSSLLAYLSDPQVQADHHLEPERTLTVMLDFLALHTCSREDLVAEILEALELATTQPAALELLQRIPEKTFTELRRGVRKLDQVGFRIVLLCDEFELAVQNPEFDQSFFGALRSLASSGVVFVTASRLNLLELEQYQSEEVRQKILGSPFFNIFAEFRVEPFEDHEVAEMLATLLDTTPIRFEREDVHLLDRIAGRHPYFLQLTAYHLYAVHERIRRSSGTDILGQVNVAHETVREQVSRESAKIFRNQWHHSPMAERHALAALALKALDPEKRPPLPRSVDERILTRLERRGLVRRQSPRDTRVERPASSETLRHYELFSEILKDWILTQVTDTLEGVSRFEDLSFELEGPGGARPGFPQPAAPGTSTSAVGRYTLLEEIGQGGSGTVFKAWDEHLERVVALKVLDHAIRSSPEHLRRLLGEARTCAGLHHPHIVVIYDIDMEQAHLVQEFLGGGSLRDLLEQVPVLGAADLLGLAEQLAAALSAAHQAGVVHRDLKPENVLLTSRPAIHAAGRGSLLPTVKLGDFGTAVSLSDLRQTEERRSVAGTLAYMAPEQMVGRGVGPAADFYSLGVLLFEACHGERPPAAGAQDAVKARAGSGEEIHRFDDILARCLAEKPKERFQDAGEILVAVQTTRAVTQATGPYSFPPDMTSF